MRLSYWYKILRNRKHFGICDAIKYAWWLSGYGAMMTPGELAVWLNDVVDAHPYAVGIPAGVLLVVFTVAVTVMMRRP